MKKNSPSQAFLDRELVNKYYDNLTRYFEDNGEEVITVPITAESLSTGYKLALPVVDSDGNEKTLLVHVMVARNHRDGTEYDPYAQHTLLMDNAINKGKQAAKE